MKGFWAVLLRWLGLAGTPEADERDAAAGAVVAEPVAGEVEAGPADEFAGAVLHTCPARVADWPVVSSLSVDIRGSKLFLSTDKPELWPNVDGCIGNIHCLLFRGGKWHGGPIDGMRPFQRNGGDRGKGCGAVPSGDSRLYEAQAGERVGFVVTGFCRNGARMKPAQRTAVGWVTWK